jgi:hypothetical protein
MHMPHDPQSGNGPNAETALGGNAPSYKTQSLNQPCSEVALHADADRPGVLDDLLPSAAALLHLQGSHLEFQIADHPHRLHGPVALHLLPGPHGRRGWPFTPACAPFPFCDSKGQQAFIAFSLM